jgi:hypothetical protein
MKTLKFLTAAFLMVVSFSAFAADGSKSEKLELSYTLKTYIAAVTQGKIAALPEVLDSNIKFTTTRGATIVNQGRTEMLNTLKFSENIVQNCTTEYTVVESNPTMSVVKLTMKYDTFSKVEFISLANTTKGWKITSVSTSFN